MWILLIFIMKTGNKIYKCENYKKEAELFPDLLS